MDARGARGAKETRDSRCTGITLPPPSPVARNQAYFALVLTMLSNTDPNLLSSRSVLDFNEGFIVSLGSYVNETTRTPVTHAESADRASSLLKWLVGAGIAVGRNVK